MEWINYGCKLVLSLIVEIVTSKLGCVKKHKNHLTFTSIWDCLTV